MADNLLERLGLGMGGYVPLDPAMVESAGMDPAQLQRQAAAQTLRMFLAGLANAKGGKGRKASILEAINAGFANAAGAGAQQRGRDLNALYMAQNMKRTATADAAARADMDQEAQLAQRLQSDDFWQAQPPEMQPYRAILANLPAKWGTSPPADRRTLLRRVTFDLTGLPPSPEDVDAFLKDDSPDAYEKVVDRLLASPHHGERWARHWLDVVRYGETDGFERNAPRPNAWHYRDWLIKALNAEMARAIDRCADLDPAACRQAARRRFDRETMIDRYLETYAALVPKRPLRAA